MCPCGGTLASSSIFARTYPTIFPGNDPTPYGSSIWSGVRLHYYYCSILHSGPFLLMVTENYSSIKCNYWRLWQTKCITLGESCLSSTCALIRSIPLLLFIFEQEMSPQCLTCKHKRVRMAESYSREHLTDSCLKQTQYDASYFAESSLGVWPRNSHSLPFQRIGN